MIYLLLCIIWHSLVFFFLFLHFFKKNADPKLYYKILYSNLKNKFDSGDLLLFSNYKYDFFSRSLGNPTISHIAIVVLINSIPYTLELVLKEKIYPDKPYVKNVILINLEDRLKNYDGNIYYSKLLKPLNNTQINKLLEMINLKVQYNLKNQCGSFIAKIIDELKISNNTYTKLFWRIHNNIIQLTNTNIYSEPIQIIQNESIIDSIDDIMMA